MFVWSLEHKKLLPAKFCFVPFKVLVGQDSKKEATGNEELSRGAKGKLQVACSLFFLLSWPTRTLQGTKQNFAGDKAELCREQLLVL